MHDTKQALRLAWMQRVTQIMKNTTPQLAFVLRNTLTFLRPAANRTDFVIPWRNNWEDSDIEDS
jgi:hypothetical protein